MVVFLSVILFVRLDFSISIDNMAEAKMRVAGAVEQVFSLENRHEGLCGKLEDAVANFRYFYIKIYYFCFVVGPFTS